MKGSKTKSSSLLAFAEKCKNILCSNWQGKLNTIKADACGSKEEIYTSKVKYFVNKGKPFIWVPQNDLHNVNTIIDERGSFSVTSPLPGTLAHLLRSIKMLPARIALTGDVLRLSDHKAKLAAEYLQETLLARRKTVNELSYAASTILNLSELASTSQASTFQDLLEVKEHYSVYQFNISSCMFMDNNGVVYDVNLEDVAKCKADRISAFSASLIDGINRSEMMRRALVLFCINFLNQNAKDAFLLSVDRKGFDVLGKVLSPMKVDGSREYQWQELRFDFKEEAGDVEAFCSQLLEMEEEALKNMSSYNGVGS